MLNSNEAANTLNKLFSYNGPIHKFSQMKMKNGTKLHR